MMRLGPFQGFNPIPLGLPGVGIGGLKKRKPQLPSAMPQMPMLPRNPFQPLMNYGRMVQRY